MNELMQDLLDTRRVRELRRIRLPGWSANMEVGLGELIKRTISRLGIQACDSCNRRASRI